MATELKTQKNDADVIEFINSVQDQVRREDAKKVLEIMNKITGEKPSMWGSSIIGYGSYHYKYSSGKEADWMAIGFSPRKQNMTLYVSYPEDYNELLDKLGPHSTSKACLYIKKLSDVDESVLSAIVKGAFEYWNGRVIEA